MDIHDAVIQRVREADFAARASQLAFMLGPEKFTEHLEAKRDEARKRIEEQYVDSVASGKD